MKSGVRTPYHLEVAEAQRIAGEREKQSLLAEQAAAAEREKLLASTTPESKGEDKKTRTTLSDIASSSSSSSSSSSNNALVTDVDDDEENKPRSLSSSSSLLVDQRPKDLDYVPSPAEPKSLTDFENLKNMPTIERFDAFYEAPKVPLTPFRFLRPWRYWSFFLKGAVTMNSFMIVDNDQAISVARQYRHQRSGVSVTLLPCVHVAHPRFWQHADELCSQHHSVLMEGRYSPTSSDISVVPPRERIVETRPEEELDAEGWEPPAGEYLQNFRQPYSWGVIDSPNHTIVHAADSYDYDMLPVWARVRHNIPVLADYKREKRCLNILHQLSQNGYESFVIPWGLAHMPVFSQMLLSNGFTPSGSTRLVLFNKTDGPVSAAYVRKLKSTLGWYNFAHSFARGTATLLGCWTGLWYFNFDFSAIVDWNDLSELGTDAKRRRAYDKAMEPSASQQRMRGMAKFNEGDGGVGALGVSGGGFGGGGGPGFGM